MLFEEILKSIKEDTITYLHNNELALVSKDIITFPITLTNIKTLEQRENSDIKINKIISIDGGNSSIIETNNYILDFVKIAFATFIKNKLHDFKIISGFISARYLPSKNNENNSLKIKVSINNYKGNILNYCNRVFYFESIKPSPNELKDAINEVRKSVEIKILKQIDILNKNTLILRDGSLNEYKEKIKNNTKLEENEENNKIKINKNENIILGISKNSMIYTNYGNHLASLLYTITSKEKLSDKPWFIKIGEKKINSKKLSIFFSKLHKKSKVVLRIDLLHNGDKNKEHQKNIFMYLTKISNSPIFLGYPYPLIIADKLARVSNEEVRIIKEIIKKASKNEENLEKLENLFNPHKFLDSIR